MRTLAIANHKGGVGKTATAHALGEALAETQRVLMVDADPQGSLTAACGVTDAGGESLAEVLGGVTPGTLTMRSILREIWPDLYLAPGDIALSASELGLAARMGRENMLKRALSDVADSFDLAIIDCPPSLGLLTVNALTAADAVLIPTQAEIMALRGLRLFLDSLEAVRDALNPNLQTFGLVATFYDSRLKHHNEAIAVLESARLPILGVIGRSVRVAEAAGAGGSVLSYEKRNPRAVEYRALAEEVSRCLSDL